MDVRLGGAEVGLSGMCWNVRARGRRPVTSCRCSSLRVLRGFADIARFGCPLGSPTISFVREMLADGNGKYRHLKRRGRCMPYCCPKTAVLRGHLGQRGRFASVGDEVL
ncbi:hypothetical protein J6590_095635 [Homalodisca vitripennis]|nr:hypothetical protein J6590_095635 [Homalodisca vitripennis]